MGKVEETQVVETFVGHIIVAVIVPVSFIVSTCPGVLYRVDSVITQYWRNFDNRCSFKVDMF